MKKIEINPVPSESEVYSFLNFEEFLKGKTLKQYAMTNKVDDKGCPASKANSIKISGKWNVNNEYQNLDTKFELQLSNEKKTKTNCEYKKDTPSEFKCLFEGGGKVKYEDNIMKN